MRRKVFRKQENKSWVWLATILQFLVLVQSRKVNNWIRLVWRKHNQKVPAVRKINIQNQVNYFVQSSMFSRSVIRFALIQRLSNFQTIHVRAVIQQNRRIRVRFCRDSIRATFTIIILKNNKWGIFSNENTNWIWETVAGFQTAVQNPRKTESKTWISIRQWWSNSSFTLVLHLERPKSGAEDNHRVGWPRKRGMRSIALSL